MHLSCFFSIFLSVGSVATAQHRKPNAWWKHQDTEFKKGHFLLAPYLFIHLLFWPGLKYINAYALCDGHYGELLNIVGVLHLFLKFLKISLQVSLYECSKLPMLGLEDQLDCTLCK